MRMNEKRRIGRGVISGALAGAASAFVFTYVHGVFISDIWFSLPLMLAAGGICGACVSWTYLLTARRLSIASWLRFNSVFVVMFVLLGVASLVLLEPITTVAEVLAAGKPPAVLFQKATPLTVAFTAGAILLLSLVYGRRWIDYLALALTCTILVALLGVNVALLGLVYIPSGAYYLVAELFLLILVLNAIFAAGFLALERKLMTSTRVLENAPA